VNAQFPVLHDVFLLSKAKKSREPRHNSRTAAIEKSSAEFTVIAAGCVRSSRVSRMGRTRRDVCLPTAFMTARPTAAREQTSTLARLLVGDQSKITGEMEFVSWAVGGFFIENDL
jgi:hypothetical protein